jgi:small subunit ribosomal protein S2
MALAEFDMRQLLEAGVHFGHQTHRWNPKMGPYIYGVRHNVHILDLTQTVPLLARALQFLKETAAAGGRVLFVGTKRQASAPIAAAAKRCGQYYVNHRWLGGMLTNWQTISQSIRVLKELDEKLAAENTGFTKKERLQLMRARDKLERALGGIRDMGGLPDVVVVIDTNREDIAVKEAKKLEIPVVAVLDTNSTPDGIAFPVPGNDDATRAINLYCDLFSAAVLEGIQEDLARQGVAIEGAEGEAAKAGAPVKEAKGGKEAKPAEPPKAEAQKAEAKKEEPKAAETKKPEPKKEEPKKEEPTKPEAKKEEPTAAEAKKPEPKKEEPKKADPKKEAKKEEAKPEPKKEAAKAPEKAEEKSKKDK